MVKIRMQRMGAKKNPQYIIVATNSTSARNGKFLDRLGYYNPTAKTADKKLIVDQDKIATWKSKGAQFSLTVSQLLDRSAK